MTPQADSTGLEQQPAGHNPLRILPSLLSCDFARIAEEIRSIEHDGADWHHVDVMDGHFVPNISIGPGVVQCVHAAASRPLDVHMMIAEPLRYAEAFVAAGAHVLTYHCEVAQTKEDLLGIADGLRAAGAPLVGVAINPETEVERVAAVLDRVDLVLIMSVHPGFGGQSFMGEVLPKVGWLREQGYTGLVEMDGGLNLETLPLCAAAGADTLVAGSAIYGASDRAATIASMRRLGLKTRS